MRCRRLIRRTFWNESIDRWPLFNDRGDCWRLPYTTPLQRHRTLTLGLAFHSDRLLYRFRAMLRWLGVALTGSDTSSNALFRQPADDYSRRPGQTRRLDLSVDHSIVLMAAAN